MRTLLRFVLPVILLAVALPAPTRAAQSVTLTLLPIADTYVNAGTSTGNFGTQDSIFLVLGTPPSRSRLLLKYDLSQIPAGSVISDADLSLHLRTRSGAATTLPLYVSGTTSAWEETAVTWDTLPTVGTTLPETLVTHTELTQVLGVTALLQEMVNAPSSSAGSATSTGFMIKTRETGSAFTWGYGARESAQPTELVVTFVPPVDTTGPVLADQRIENVNLTSADAVFTTDEDATVTIDLGLDMTYGRSISTTSTARSHRVTLFPLASNSLYHYRIRARDAAGNESVSSDATFSTLESSGAFPAGSLVKIPDDRNPETQADSAVYYVGSDGKRHAFPSFRVYQSWYADFSGVQTISVGQMAALPLGANVRYRPGTRLLKFTTVPTVYTISRGGGLRALSSEQVAADIFGAAWATQVDDLSDILFGNYTFGAPISSSADYSPTAERDATTTIDQDQGRA